MPSFFACGFSGGNRLGKGRSFTGGSFMGSSAVQTAAFVTGIPFRTWVPILLVHEVPKVNMKDFH